MILTNSVVLLHLNILNHYLHATMSRIKQYVVSEVSIASPEHPGLELTAGTAVPESGLFSW